jgi:hypothetical protein
MSGKLGSLTEPVDGFPIHILRLNERNRASRDGTVLRRGPRLGLKTRCAVLHHTHSDWFDADQRSKTCAGFATSIWMLTAFKLSDIDVDRVL